jgi:DNA-binding beta-propeller fold protein YncE
MILPRFTSSIRSTGRIIGLLTAGVLLAGCAAQPVKVQQKATSFWPPAPDEPRIQFLRSYEQSTDVGSAKSGLDKLILGDQPESSLQITKPYGVKMWQGKIYVCDTKQKAVIVLDVRQKITRMMGVSGIKLENPSDIAIAPEGTKYVADPQRGAVVVFDAKDQQIATFGHPNFRPVAVAVHNDELAVADFQLQRIEIMDRRTGQVRRTVGSAGIADGQFVRPLAVAYDREGNLVTSDFMKCRIQKFDPSGKLISAIGEISAAAGNFIRPKHIALDKDGYLYVVDAGFQNVQLFNEQGYLLTFFGAAGTHPGAMQLPAGIAVDDDPQDIALFKDYVHPMFVPDRLIIVTNQTGPNRVAIYALGKLKPGVTAADITGSRIEVPVAASQPTTQPALAPEPNEPPPPPATGPLIPVPGHTGSPRP